MSTLSTQEIRDGLPEGWTHEDDAIHRTFEFDSFMEAVEFINRVATAADEANHHPDLRNSYTTVEISLTTHSEGGVTDNDLELAARIDELA